MSRPLPTRPKRRQPERTEQAHIINLLGSVATKTYVLGTTRAKRCHECGAFSRDMSTRQTPGIGDVVTYLPRPPLPSQDGSSYPNGCEVWIEVKAPGGKPSEAQDEHAALCLARGIPHITGGLTAVVQFLVRGGWLKPENVGHYHLTKES